MEKCHALCTVLVNAVMLALIHLRRKGEDQIEEDEERQEDMKDGKETDHLDHVFGTDDEWE